MNNDYSLLREFDPAAAEPGEPICTEAGAPRKFVYGPDKLGNISTMRDEILLSPCTVGFFRKTPLGWCEGKPVYEGDRLYVRDSDGSTALLAYKPHDFGAFTWIKPKTKKVKLLAWLTPMGRLIWSEEAKDLLPIECKRVPSEDKEVEVEL